MGLKYSPIRRDDKHVFNCPACARMNEFRLRKGQREIKWTCKCGTKGRFEMHE